MTIRFELPALVGFLLLTVAIGTALNVLLDTLLGAHPLRTAPVVLMVFTVGYVGGWVHRTVIALGRERGGGMEKAREHSR